MSVLSGCQAPQMYHSLPRDFYHHEPPPPPPSSLPPSQPHHHQQQQHQQHQQQQQRYLPSMETLSAAAAAAAAAASCSSSSLHSSPPSSDNNNSSIAYFQNLMFNCSSQYPPSAAGPDYATLSSSSGAGGAIPTDPMHPLHLCSHPSDAAAVLYPHSAAAGALPSNLYMNYDDLPLLLPPGSGGGSGAVDDGTVPRVRTVKRRVSSNRKERRRTHSINTAFAALRGCIPNVPSDTKLSKIKTLRLATSYIAYLMDILNKDDPKLAEGGFKADISRKIESREEKRKRESEEILKAISAHGEEKPSRGRTGWPQQVWAAELKQ